MPGDFGQGLPLTPDGGGQNHEVVHGPGQADSDQKPKEARSETELGGQDRPDEGARAGDIGKMLAEEDGFGDGFVVGPIVQGVGRSHAGIVQGHDFRCQEGAVIAVGDDQDQKGGQH